MGGLGPAWWFGILWVPLRIPIPFIFGDPRNPNHRAPNHQLGVSKNNGTPKSSILIGFSIINHPFWGPTPIFGNIQLTISRIWGFRKKPHGMNTQNRLLDEYRRHLNRFAKVQRLKTGVQLSGLQIADV